MSDIGKPERATQDRVIALFHQQLGYTYLGDWSGRASHGNIEEGLETANLARLRKVKQRMIQKLNTVKARMA